MIRVIANKTLAFDRGELDREGRLVREKTKIGYCELPDWCSETDYFKLAVEDGSIKSFTATLDDERVQQAQQRLMALKEEIKALEEQKEVLVAANKPTEDVDAEIAEQKEQVKSARK